LLISIDGMHALDYANCVSGGYCPHLADLGKTGVNYTRTSTSRPSDSFPGLMALVTGGTPALVGAFYDVAFDRVLAPPQNDTGNGVFSGACVPNTPNGTTTEYEEGVDINQTLLNGGNGKSLTDGDWTSIDSTRLPRDPIRSPTPALLYILEFHPRQHNLRGHPCVTRLHGVGRQACGLCRGLRSDRNSHSSNVDDYYSRTSTPTWLACRSDRRQRAFVRKAHR